MLEQKQGWNMNDYERTSAGNRVTIVAWQRVWGTTEMIFRVPGENRTYDLSNATGMLWALIHKNALKWLEHATGVKIFSVIPSPSFITTWFLW